VVEPVEVEDAEIIEAEEVSGDDVALHVARHLDTSDISKRTSQLGAEIDQADEVVESHLQDVFEHRLGDLGAKTQAPEQSTLDDDETQAKGPTAAPAAQPGISIVEMLRSPRELRSAVILSEILARPEHHW
jgi:hypothetical protein